MKLDLMNPYAFATKKVKIFPFFGLSPSFVKCYVPDAASMLEKDYYLQYAFAKATHQLENAEFLATIRKLTPRYRHNNEQEPQAYQFLDQCYQPFAAAKQIQESSSSVDEILVRLACLANKEANECFMLMVYNDLKRGMQHALDFYDGCLSQLPMLTRDKDFKFQLSFAKKIYDRTVEGVNIASHMNFAGYMIDRYDMVKIVTGDAQQADF